MPVFTRRSSHPQPKKDYTAYRPLVREDFAECCAYCLLHEIAAGGFDAFEIDHYRPKVQAELAGFIHDFFNLYYACRACNGYKGSSWPDPDQEAFGYGFIDFCAEDFSRHFEEQPDGVWRPLTRAGEYTAAKVRLNRAHLVRIRLLLRRLATLQAIAPVDWNRPSRDQILTIFGA